LAQSVYNSAQKLVRGHDARRSARSVNGAARLYLAFVAEEYAAEAVLFEVLHHALYARCKDQDLAVYGIFKARYRGYSVAHRQNRARLIGHSRGDEVFHSLFYHGYGASV